MSIGQIKPKLTDETIKKLEEVFAIDGTIQEACFFANITPPTYHGWVKEMPELKERFNRLRNKPVLKARQTVFKGIGENYSNAMDYLKRKRKSEFGDIQKIDLETINVTKKEKKTVGDVINNFLNDEYDKTNS